MERRKSITKPIILALIAIAFYWFVIHPNTYRYHTAVKNGDVVMGPSGKKNVEKLYTFIKNVEIKQADKIRITAYSKEGDPEIIDLNFDGKIIKATIDNTRDHYGRDWHKKHGEYTKITKDEKKNYLLIDESGKYPDVWIYQE